MRRLINTCKIRDRQRKKAIWLGPPCMTRDYNVGFCGGGGDFWAAAIFDSRRQTRLSVEPTSRRALATDRRVARPRTASRSRLAAHAPRCTAAWALTTTDGDWRLVAQPVGWPSGSWSSEWAGGGDVGVGDHTEPVLHACLLSRSTAASCCSKTEVWTFLLN